MRVDAHLHFFQPGFVGRLPETCRRVQPDEVTLYQALAQQHDVAQVLAVGYEGAAWAAGNNRYLATLAAAHPWIRPVAFASDPAALDLATLETYAQQRFAGLSMYLFGEEQTAPLARMPDEVWTWIERHGWLISVNSRGESWSAWAPVLERHPDLCLLVSHLGLPRALKDPPDPVAAREALAPICALARFPGVHVKLSGFYALTDPGYAYPHHAAWPYVATLLEDFGPTRLLWGSDFSPSLEWLSFPQTYALFAEMPFLDAPARQRIEGDNLRVLLARQTDRADQAHQTGQGDRPHQADQSNPVSQDQGRG